MGTDKGSSQYLVKWAIWILGLAVLAAVRYTVWKNEEIKLVSGTQIRIVQTVRNFSQTSWGKTYLRLGRKGEIQVEKPIDLQINYGDKVVVVGTLQNRVIGGKNVGFRLINSHFERILASKWQNWLNHWRMGLRDKVQNWLPGDEGGLAAGILWGGNEGVSEKGSENFQVAGLTHVLAASGYNVSVVAAWIMSLGVKIWGRRRAIYFGIVCITLYVFLAGAQAAVIRAGIMASLALIALLFGRKMEAVWGFTLAGIIMVIVSPGFLDDIEWQLSMAATAGLLWVGGGKESSLVMSDLKTTLAAQVATLPIILYNFGSVSIVAPLTNLLVLWTVPLVMQIVAVATGLGLLWDEAGRVVSYLAWPLLRWMTMVTEWSASLPWSVIKTGSFEWSWVLIYYGLLIVVGKFWRRKG